MDREYTTPEHPDRRIVMYRRQSGVIVGVEHNPADRAKFKAVAAEIPVQDLPRFQEIFRRAIVKERATLETDDGYRVVLPWGTVEVARAAGDTPEAMEARAREHSDQALACQAVAAHLADRPDARSEARAAYPTYEELLDAFVQTRKQVRR